VLALLAALAFWRAAQTRLSSRQVFAMDTVMQLSAYGRARAVALDACEDEIARLDALFSAQSLKATSRASTPARGNLCPSPTRRSKSCGRKGLCPKKPRRVDVTVYPIVRAWGFISKDFRVLSEQDLVFLRPLVGSERIDVTTAACASARACR
jgi:thiamine biosynthesis lipoprotein